ncbi:DUF6503 family protein [Daejeonella oryzae]|uniref:DUF6503 family protein n=1 Tax=Daejeonella oryzae TaxID=1122943 RepID=UPI00055F9840|nr:DUF6503 family protein [Daejeonella oryzae]
MRYAFLIICFMCFISGCSKPDAKTIVDKSVAFYNMEKLQNATLEFDFRNFKFKAMQLNGKFVYERSFSDSTGQIHDILSNDSFKRMVNGKELKLDAEQAAKYAQAVNSVIYFVYLPLKLNDPSVIKKYLGESSIKNKSYYKLEVRFEQKGGGQDHDDVFYYWFDKEDYSMDHFAYSTGGNRFRQVMGSHKVSGVTFQDYINYEAPEGDSLTPLIKYDSLFTKGKLKELSRIEIKNIRLN